MKYQNKIAIILPVFNGEVYLSEALDSILIQTHEKFELILVNDGSTDASLQIATAFAAKDNRIKIINNPANLKLPGSLNVGHAAATSDYLTWTSHDNVLKSNFLEVLLHEMKTSNADIVFSDYDIIHADGRLKRVHSAGPVEHLLYGNKVGSSFLYRKKVYESLVGYATGFFLVEDYDFWLRASLQFKCFHIKQNLYDYRLQPQSLTTQISDDIESKKKYRDGLNSIFEAMAKKLEWSAVTKNLLLDIQYGDQLSLGSYLMNKKTIKTDLKKYSGDLLDYDKVHAGLMNQLRQSLKRNGREKNWQNLFNVLLHERKILFAHGYSGKETLKLIFKMMF